MDVLTLRRRFEFDAAHRLVGHEGKCASLHGHRYVAEIEVEGCSTDQQGRLIDFGVIKEYVGGWIDAHWDHALILSDDIDNDGLKVLYDDEDQRLYVMGSWLNEAGLGHEPTAENMAEELFKVTTQLLEKFRGLVRVSAVRIWETPNAWAEYRP